MVTFSLRQIIEWTNGRVVNEQDLVRGLDKVQVNRIATLGESQPNDVTFYYLRSFAAEFARAKPGILVTNETMRREMGSAPVDYAIVVCADPYSAMAQLSAKFADRLSSVAHIPLPENFKPTSIHPTAVIDPSVEMGEGVQVGPHCVIERGCRIGARTVLYPGCFVGPQCVIGSSCVLFPRVTLYELTQLGDRVRIHAGAVIGADGFGYAPKREGRVVTGHQKIYHMGRVLVGDDVEIGANACVDRGTFGDTRLGKNVKLDNQVQVGHNAQLDEGAILCGSTSLAGHASIGKYAYLGGLTGVTNHTHIGDGAMVGALSLITKDVPPGGTAVGSPQRTQREHFKAHAFLNKLLTKKRSTNYE